MDNSLFVLHILKNQGHESAHIQDQFLNLKTDPNLVYFETCLRRIWISNYNLFNVQTVESAGLGINSSTLSLTSSLSGLVVNSEAAITPESIADISSAFSIELLKDEKAYSFLLEVLCGLKSPVIGETEVFGQFKTQVLKHLDAKNPIAKIIHSIVADTKSIRSLHLLNLGSSSYGSLARKSLNGFKNLDILGAGQFVQSLKPWIEKLNIQTQVYTRSPEKYLSVYDNSEWSLKLLTEFSSNLSSNEASDKSYHRSSDLSVDMVPDVSAQRPKALFICAPINLESTDLKSYDLVIDFRDGENQRIEHSNIKSLAQVFNEIQKENILAEKKKIDALAEIVKASENFMTSMNHRPFGWDDISA